MSTIAIRPDGSRLSGTPIRIGGFFRNACQEIRRFLPAFVAILASIRSANASHEPDQLTQTAAGEIRARGREAYMPELPGAHRGSDRALLRLPCSVGCRRLSGLQNANAAFLDVQGVFPVELTKASEYYRNTVHTVDGWLFQSRMWRAYAMCWNGRKTANGIDQRWCEQIGRFTREQCIARAQYAASQARNTNVPMPLPK